MAHNPFIEPSISKSNIIVNSLVYYQFMSIFHYGLSITAQKCSLKYFIVFYSNSFMKNCNKNYNYSFAFKHKEWIAINEIKLQDLPVTQFEKTQTDFLDHNWSQNKTQQIWTKKKKAINGRKRQFIKKPHFGRQTTFVLNKRLFTQSRDW